MTDPKEGLAGQLGIEMGEMGEDRVTATLDVDERHHQPAGIMHGGTTLALAETVASVGANLASDDGKHAVGMEFNANHIRPVKQDTLTAVATPVHRGQTTHVWSVEIKDSSGHLVTISRCTMAIREH